MINLKKIFTKKANVSHSEIQTLNEPETHKINFKLKYVLINVVLIIIFGALYFMFWSTNDVKTTNFSVNLINKIEEIKIVKKIIDTVFVDNATKPSQILDLTNWKLTLPISEDDDNDNALEIKQPELNDEPSNSEHKKYFFINKNKNAVVFKAFANGATTSGTKYPRSELREMMPGNNKKEVSWSSKDFRSMYIEQAVTHLPDKKPHVVVGQIHTDNDNVLDDVYVFRLEKNTEKDDDNFGKIKLFGFYVDQNDKLKQKEVVFTNDYKLGQKFNVKFEVENNKIKSFYNGKLMHTLDSSFDGAYFKAGMYSQSSCTKNSDDFKGENCNSYGEVEIYNLEICSQKDKCKN